MFTSSNRSTVDHQQVTYECISLLCYNCSRTGHNSLHCTHARSSPSNSLLSGHPQITAHLSKSDLPGLTTPPTNTEGAPNLADIIPLKPPITQPIHTKSPPYPHKKPLIWHPFWHSWRQSWAWMLVQYPKRRENKTPLIKHTTSTLVKPFVTTYMQKPSNSFTNLDINKYQLNPSGLKSQT